MVWSQCSITGCGIELSEPTMEKKWKWERRNAGRGIGRHGTWTNERTKGRARKSWRNGCLLQDNCTIKKDKGCPTSPTPPHPSTGTTGRGHSVQMPRLKTERGRKTRGPVSLRLAQKHQGRPCGWRVPFSGCLSSGTGWLSSTPGHNQAF